MLELHPSFRAGPSTPSQPGEGHGVGSAAQAPPPHEAPLVLFGRELTILLFSLYRKVSDKRGGGKET